MLSVQLAETQAPALSTLSLLEHAKHELGPGPEHDEQEESHDWHVEDVLSKYWPLEQVGRQRPLVSRGRLGGQLEHWLNALPEHVAQSG